MSALFSLSAIIGLVLSMWFAYVLARFVTGYPAREVDEWERENVGKGDERQ